MTAWPRPCFFNPFLHAFIHNDAQIPSVCICSLSTFRDFCLASSLLSSSSPLTFVDDHDSQQIPKLNISFPTVKLILWLKDEWKGFLFLLLSLFVSISVTKCFTGFQIYVFCTYLCVCVFRWYIHRRFWLKYWLSFNFFFLPFLLYIFLYIVSVSLVTLSIIFSLRRHFLVYFYFQNFQILYFSLLYSFSFRFYH